MSEINETMPIKEILTVASPLIKSVIDTFITPKLISLKKRVSLDYKKYYVPSEENFSEYLHRTYKRVSVINTLVFNNTQKALKDIYIPLTLTNNSSKKEEKFKIVDYPTNLFSKYEKILITDNAGMGKSTLVKKLFLDTIDEKIGIPILVELRRLSKEKNILDEIQELVNALTKEFDSTLLLELLSEGGFTIFLDGFDEIPLSDREKVTADIQNFIAKASNNKFILTSRPESALKSFGDFQEVRIEPLKRKEAFELLRKYDKQGQVSTLLIKKIEESEMNNISEFLTNPLLVSLLFTAFQHRQTIPFKKHIFYRQVYDANFESHDLTKGDSYTHDKYSKLEIDDFHKVLRHIGFSCLKDNQRIEFTKDELLSLISKARAFCVDLTFNDSDFLKDLLSTVPLFTQDGNYYRWAHKSLQEYFAAQFIYLDSNDQKGKILLQLFNHQNLDKYINILDLYYDIDTKTFRNTILFELLKEFEQHINNFFQNFDNDIPKEQIECRKELSFLNDPFVFIIPNKENFALDENIDEMIKSMTNKRISGAVHSPNTDKLLCCLNAGNAKEILINMLSHKLPNVFHVQEVQRDTENEVLININHDIAKPYEPYFLNDKIDDKFNTKDNFYDVNKLIMYSKIFPICIKTNEAISLLTNIREQIEEEKNQSFVL